MVSTLNEILSYAWMSIVHMYPYLLAGILLTATVQSLVPQDRLRGIFTGAGIWPVVIATLVAVSTPLCSCTTVSMMIPLLAAGVPWGPIVAWLIASPMMSPTGFLLVGGTLGWDLAWGKLIIATLLGLTGGWTADWLARRGALRNQSRIPLAAGREPEAASGCGQQGTAGPAGIGSGLGAWRTLRLTFWGTLSSTLRTVVPAYLLFLLVAGLIQVLVPTEWVTAAFGSRRAWAIPAAAALGVPMYVSVSSAVPLAASFLQLGMSRGAAMAFLLTGPGTSLPAMGALVAVARTRVIAFYLAFLYVGVVALSWVFDLVR